MEAVFGETKKSKSVFDTPFVDPIRGKTGFGGTSRTNFGSQTNFGFQTDFGSRTNSFTTGF